MQRIHFSNKIIDIYFQGIGKYENPENRKSGENPEEIWKIRRFRRNPEDSDPCLELIVWF